MKVTYFHLREAARLPGLRDLPPGSRGDPIDQVVASEVYEFHLEQFPGVTVTADWTGRRLTVCRGDLVWYIPFENVAAMAGAAPTLGEVQYYLCQHGRTPAARPCPICRPDVEFAPPK